MIYAADLLIYIGDLEPFFQAARKALRPAGILAVSVESDRTADFQILSSGRFAHSPSYIERLTDADFDRLDRTETTIRLEANRPVAGDLFVFGRR